MIKDISELKALAIWAKEQKIKVLQVDNVRVEFSDLAFLDDLKDLGVNEPKTNPHVNAGIGSFLDEADELTDQEREDLLYHSARP